MRLAFWRTEKLVARPVLQPGADSPYVPRLGVWMEPDKAVCVACGRHVAMRFIVYWPRDGAKLGNGPLTQLNTCSRGFYCEKCGAKLVAQLRREREG